LKGQKTHSLKRALQKKYLQRGKEKIRVLICHPKGKNNNKIKMIQSALFNKQLDKMGNIHKIRICELIISLLRGRYVGVFPFSNLFKDDIID